MGRAPCCEKIGLKKGPWSAQEDQILISYIQQHGHPNWRALPKQAGLLRCGKSCRLRWVNYLSPSIKRGNFSSEEEEAIIKLHEMMGNRWSAIAAKLPGRTDNEIKNIWHTHLKKRLNNKSDDKMPSNQNINIDDYLLQINSNGGCSSDVSISTQTVQSPQDSINTTTSTVTTTTTTTHQQEVSTSLGEVSEMSQSISSGIQEFNIDDEYWWQNLMAEDSHNLNSSCILSPTHPDPLHEFGYGFGFGFDDQQHDHSSYTTNTSGDHHSTGDFWYGVLIGAGGGSPPDILPNF